jgi:hypothetical protein
MILIDIDVGTPSGNLLFQFAQCRQNMIESRLFFFSNSIVGRLLSPSNISREREIIVIAKVELPIDQPKYPKRYDVSNAKSTQSERFEAQFGPQPGADYQASDNPGDNVQERTHLRFPTAVAALPMWGEIYSPIHPPCFRPR